MGLQSCPVVPVRVSTTLPLRMSVELGVYTGFNTFSLLKLPVPSLVQLRVVPAEAVASPIV